MMKTERREPACDKFQESIQRFLDGDANAFDAAGEAHRSVCASCQTDYLAAHRLALGISLQMKPVVPADFTGRLVTAVLSDQVRPSNRGMTSRWLEVLAIAACLLLVIALGMHFMGRDDQVQSPPSAPEVATVPQANPVDLEHSFAEASSAVASLSRRTADETIEPARRLIATAAETPVLKTEPVAGFVRPPGETLAPIRQGAAIGFEPMANSARRAVSLFMRDLPLDNERKRDF
jgi:hypothetical protein